MNSATGGVAPWEPSRSATPPVVMHVMVGSGFWVLGSGFWVLGSGLDAFAGERTNSPYGTNVIISLLFGAFFSNQRRVDCCRGGGMEL